MKNFFHICSLIIVMLMSALRSEAGLHDLHTEFTYEADADREMTGFYIYCNNIRVPNVIVEPFYRSFDFILNTTDVNLLSDNVTATFTMTAVFSDGSESPSSPPFLFTISKPIIISVPQGFQFGNYKNNLSIPTNYSYQYFLMPECYKVGHILTTKKILITLNHFIVS